eukprot:3003847-Amphidinium_carterae.2
MSSSANPCVHCTSARTEFVLSVLLSQRWSKVLINARVILRIEQSEASVFCSKDCETQLLLLSRCAIPHCYPGGDGWPVGTAKCDEHCDTE